ncbi:hypothetical protein ATY41_04845 [Leifsonia xyli subsp. xyli]|uniref:Peptidoglycan binding-like domain-containing protein n=1 Tax=Leifsonia xyli subsp. xyli TaxID=59736 RepID=A0A1E2SIB7_LEIXY|nr:peptidoglycan-binding protein [Leifsonia xyli]ODA89605.1 hypothetical protein ATY41_04845 [Leifsonia xyli subsp. xyli]
MTPAETGTKAGDPATNPRRRRRGLLIGGAGVLTAVLCAGGVAAFAVTGGDGTPAAKAAPAHTATIKRGTLQGSVKATGTLSFGDGRTIGSATGGTVTELPAPGATVDTGGKLFAVDNKPAFLLTGEMPAFRSFESGMANGPDIAALETSLKKLGFLTREPGNRFTGSTAAAIKHWQKATGQEATGAIPFGTVVFAPGPVRVGEAKAHLGDQIGAGGPLLAVTDTVKRVDVDVKLSDQGVAAAGVRVGIELPNDQTTSGVVSSVGVPVERDDKKTVVPVVVALDDPGATGALQRASVTVSFPSEKREGVLSVPVSALLALQGDRFGVEVVVKNGPTKRVPVKTGAFIDGRVEISGDDIADGERVVVPSL